MKKIENKILPFKSLHEIGIEFKNQNVTSVDIVKEILDRTNSLDKHLNSFITINPEALKIAKEVDIEIRQEI